MLRGRTTVRPRRRQPDLARTRPRTDEQRPARPPLHEEDLEALATQRVERMDDEKRIRRSTVRTGSMP